MLSLLHVLEWRAAVTPAEVALTDHLGAELTFAALAAQTNERAGQYAAAGPTGVTTVEALPRNATGKVLRAALREPFWAGRDRRVS